MAMIMLNIDSEMTSACANTHSHCSLDRLAGVLPQECGSIAFDSVRWTAHQMRT